MLEVFPKHCTSANFEAEARESCARDLAVLKDGGGCSQSFRMLSAFRRTGARMLEEEEQRVAEAAGCSLEHEALGDAEL